MFGSLFGRIALVWPRGYNSVMTREYVIRFRVTDEEKCLCWSRAGCLSLSDWMRLRLGLETLANVPESIKAENCNAEDVQVRDEGGS